MDDQKTLGQRVWEGVKDMAQEAVVDLKPYARGGLVDLQNAVVHAWPDSQHQASMPGMYGQPPTQEVFNERSLLEEKVAEQPEPEKEPAKDRGMDMS